MGEPLSDADRSEIVRAWLEYRDAHPEHRFSPLPSEEGVREHMYAASLAAGVAQERERAEQDAKRYRWLRGGLVLRAPHPHGVQLIVGGADIRTAEQLDAVTTRTPLTREQIDAAIRPSAAK